MQIIPFNPDGSFQLQISLTGSTFILQFHWNALNEFWAMDIYTGNLTPVVLGIKIVTNYDISGQYVYANMPAGTIVCQNFNNQWFDIGRFDMGSTTELVYYEPGEWQITGTDPYIGQETEVA